MDMDYTAFVEIGTPVVLRSYVSGIIVGKLARGANGCVALSEWRFLRSWQGTGGKGSVYDLIQSSVKPADRGPVSRNLGIFQQSDVVVIDDATYGRLFGE